MASMRDIKRRKTSIQSTQQITKAMKLVSTVKLQKAKARAESNKPYFNMMYSTVCSILSKSNIDTQPFFNNNGSDKKATIVISSNRGLAGGYNSNIVKLITKDERFTPSKVEAYTIGRKGYEGLVRKGYTVVEDFSEVINEPLFKDAIEISEKVLKSYMDGEVGEIYLAYTNFKNTVTHEPILMKLLPLDKDMSDDVEEIQKSIPMNYEPEAEDTLSYIIPKYISSILYGAFLEAIASENGARMQAMDSATSNADEMIEDLSLMFNRARQSSITQELTEIIAGAQAIS